MKTLLRTSAFLVSLFLALPAFGAARTFVASTGVDNSTCSLVAPCRSFAAAIAVTDVNGEVLVLDSAGYGILTVTKSISIIAPDGVYAGITVPSGQIGVIVNGAGIDVTLRGLTVNGLGGNNGITVLDGNDIRIERCTISNFISSGIRIQSAAAKVVVRDTQITGNGAGSVLGAINVVAGTLTLDRVHVGGNPGRGLMANPGASTTVRVTVRDSVFSGNADTAVQVFASNAGAVANVTVERSTAMQNTGNGFAVSATTGTATLVVTSSFATGNSTGASAGGSATARLYVRDSTITNNGSGILGFAPGIANSCGNNLVAENDTNLFNVTAVACNQ